MTTWRHFELGARFRRLAGGGEERVGLDRLSGKPVTLRVYPRAREGVFLPPALEGAALHLAQPLEVDSEEGEAILARELAFGPSLDDLMRLGPQPALVVSALLHQLLEGLSQLHRAGRTHLRLSPEAVRFDLLAGVLKITDLEEALFESAPPEELIPRYLEPEIRSGAGRPAQDVYSVGRIGEALLRGGAPLGPWDEAAWGGAGPGPLWGFIQRCQSPSAAERPADAVEALAQLERLALPQAPALTLPLSAFVRAHVRALRELRRWRAQPLPPLGPRPGGQSYREILSSAQASRLWSGVGAAALFLLMATWAVAQSPDRAALGASGLPSDTCEADARPQVLEPGAHGSAAVPEGMVPISLAVPDGQIAAIDGCLVRGEPGKPVSLAVSRGTHEFRAAQGSLGAALSLEVQPGEKVTLEAEKAPSSGVADAVGSLARRLEQGPVPAPDGGGVDGFDPRKAVDGFDPIEAGMLDPLTRELLEADRAVFGSRPEASSELPLGLGLTIDALRAARRRFDAAGTLCAAGLSTAVARELGSGTDDSERALQLAVELLTITRIRGAQMREPLRTEKEALEQLGVLPSRRVLSAVEQLSAQPEIAKCLAELGPKATRLGELSVLAIGQLPGLHLSEEPADDDSTQ